MYSYLPHLYVSINFVHKSIYECINGSHLSEKHDIHGNCNIIQYKYTYY